MTTQKRAIIAGVLCVLLVGVARDTIRLDAPFGYAGALVLFPGSIPNLLFFGVHRDWGLIGEITMFTISAGVWFPVIYGFLGMVAKEFPGKTQFLRANAASRELAWRAFEGKYPERKMLKNWRTKPQKDKDGKVIVCIVWDSSTIPPHRTWWEKKDGADEFEELSGDEASKRVDVGIYR